VVFEQTHVEDIMQVCAFQKLQLVGKLANAFQHLERTDVTRAKVPFGPWL
jgi:hypothetical protein